MAEDRKHDVRLDYLGRPTHPHRANPSSAALAQLEAALDVCDLEGIASEVSAWLGADRRSDELVRCLCGWTARHQGALLDPSLGALADCARAAAELEAPRSSVPWILAAQWAAERLCARAVVQPPRPAPSCDFETLSRAVARRDVDAAEALAWAACADGAPLDALESWLLRLAALFPGDGGVMAVAVLKLCDLRAAAGDSAVLPLYAQMARALAERPEQLAYTQAHAARMAALTPRPEVMAAAESPDKQRVFVEPKFRVHLVGARADVAWKATAKALEFGVPHASLAASLVLAASERILRFDQRHEADEFVGEGWADVGHLLVLASSIRQLRGKVPAADWIGLFLFGVGLVQASGALDAPEAERAGVPEPEVLRQTWDHGPEIAKILTHLKAGRSEKAMAVLRGYLLLVLPEQPLCRELTDAALSAPVALAVDAAQLVTLTAAATDAFHALDAHPERAWPLCAALRAIAAPRRGGQRHRLAFEAVGGAAPRLLVGAGPSPG